MLQSSFCAGIQLGVHKALIVRLTSDPLQPPPRHNRTILTNTLNSSLLHNNRITLRILHPRLRHHQLRHTTMKRQRQPKLNTRTIRHIRINNNLLINLTTKRRRSTNRHHKSQNLRTTSHLNNSLISQNLFKTTLTQRRRQNLRGHSLRRSILLMRQNRRQARHNLNSIMTSLSIIITIRRRFKLSRQRRTHLLTRHNMTHRHIAINLSTNQKKGILTSHSRHTPLHRLNTRLSMLH